MLQYFRDLFCKIKYNKNNKWFEICKINDTDMVILIHRMENTNHIAIEVFDKIPGNSEKYELRACYTSAGNLKYATMPGFSAACEECQNTEDTNLDDLIKESEQNI